MQLGKQALNEGDQQHSCKTQSVCALTNQCVTERAQNGVTAAPLSCAVANLVPSNAASVGANAELKQYVTTLGIVPTDALPSSIVDSHKFILPRTMATHGLTGYELARLAAATRFMELHSNARCRLWWLVTDKGSNRHVISDAWKRVTRLQVAQGITPYSLVVFEATGGLHANILYIGNPTIAARLRCSKSFGSVINIKPVTDAQKLSQAYLAKERTPQAGYRRSTNMGGRLRGSHSLPGGGDRVRLSRCLERDAVDSGYVRPWRHTYARRLDKLRQLGRSLSRSWVPLLA